MLLAVLELSLWAMGLGSGAAGNDPYAGFAATVPHFVTRTEPDGQQWVTVAPSKTAVLNPQRFAARKAEGTYRVVCVGGSTTYGRPFFDQTSFAGWLRAFLPAADASHPWEVINAGAISYASYRAANVMDELAAYEPDLFIVYTGHNEFLERRTYPRLSETPSAVTNVLARIGQTRTARAMRDVLASAGGLGPQRSPAKSILGETVKRVPVNAVGPEAYHRDDGLARDVVAHFRATLERMVRIARQCGAEILFIVPAANLADFAPFKSDHPSNLTPADLSRFDQHVARARSLLDKSQYAAALDEIQAAVKIDARYSALLYLKGQALQSLGRYNEARESLIRARDEDICPLRAISPLVQTVRDVAAAYGNCLVDFEQLATERSKHGLPGRDLFHDHVHPTVEANRLLALAIVEYLQARSVVRAADSWNEQTIARVTGDVESRMDKPLCARELRSLSSMLAWLKQPDQARYQAELSLGLSGRGLPELLDLADKLRGQRAWKLAAEYYREALVLARDSAEAMCGWGWCLTETGEANAGMAQFRAALEHKPGLVEARHGLARALLKLGQPAEAEQQLREVARLAPDVADVLADLAVAIADQGRFREATPYCERALTLSPKCIAAHYGYGLALEGLGQSELARDHYRRALLLDPDHEQARARLRGLDQLRRP